MEKWPLGVFTSIDAGLGVVFDVVEELKVPTVHLHAPHANSRNEQTAKSFNERCANAGVTVTCVFAGFEGESYADIATTAKTVGLVPKDTRAARVAELKEISDFCKELGVNVVGKHIGFISDDDSDDYHQLIEVTRDILDHLAGNGQNMHLETGQETAEHLLKFHTDVGKDNLFVNFDPANMILYGTGDPIQALKKVGHLVKSIHCKDATWADEAVRGKEWGCEVPLGAGDVGMETYLRTLNDLGYEGPLTIEREIPEDPVRQKKDIGQALELLKTLREKILG